MGGYELPSLRFFSESLRRERCWLEAHERVEGSAELRAALKSLEDWPRSHEHTSEQLAPLGDDLLSLLVELRALSDFDSQSESNNTEARSREAARKMLYCIIEKLEMLNRFLGIGADFTPIVQLERALQDLGFGQNSKLLIVGELSKLVRPQCFSELGRTEIRAHSAVMVELLLSQGYERRQLAAANHVAKILRRAGYLGANNRFPTADTVKRWHNRARKPVVSSPTNTRNRSDELLRVLYACIVFPFDPKIGTYQHPMSLLQVRVFDPNTYAELLESRCQELRIPHG